MLLDTMPFDMPCAAGTHNELYCCVRPFFIDRYIADDKRENVMSQLVVDFDHLYIDSGGGDSTVINVEGMPAGQRAARHTIYMWLAHSTFSPNKAGPTLSQYHRDVPVANTQCGCSNQLSLHSYQLSIGSDQISMGSYQALRSSQLAKQVYHCLL